MARFGSGMIIGHGIPEAMQQVLANRSRIPPKAALLNHGSTEKDASVAFAASAP